MHDCMKRIEDAIKDKSGAALACVFADDVVCLHGHIKERDAVADALADGAKSALEGHDEVKKGKLKVWQLADQLRRMISATKQG